MDVKNLKVGVGPEEIALIFSVKANLDPKQPSDTTMAYQTLDLQDLLEQSRQVAETPGMVETLGAGEAQSPGLQLDGHKAEAGEGGGTRVALPGILTRLEKLERQNRRLKWAGSLLALVMLATLTGLGFLADRFPGRGSKVGIIRGGLVEADMIVLRGPGGKPSAWLGESVGRPRLELCGEDGKARAVLGLGKDGEPSLCLYDRDQKYRAKLGLGPDGEPGLDLVKNASTPAEVSAIPSEVATPSQYVASKTSNKYHLPTCKWAKLINPENLLTFPSVGDAREHDYIPCPTCRPPLAD